MTFRLFDQIDEALLKQEQHTERASKSAAVWPSEASVVLFPVIQEQSESPLIGKCHRAAYLRMIGEPQSNKIDSVGARRFRTGKLIETDVIELAKLAGVHVASGVRYFVKELSLPLELDLVVLDPDTQAACIVENKTFYGYWATKEILKNGKPKVENILQLLVYLYEFPTGAALKQAIATSLAEKEELDKQGRKHRNRIQVTSENLEKMSDGPLTAKLAYQSRDECLTREFDISIQQGPDGMHLPVVDGQVWNMFNIESIYSRYKVLQGYWQRAREEAVARLAKRGIFPPPEEAGVPEEEDSEQKKAQERAYWDQVAEEVRVLPYEFLPPAEYEYRYSNEKIEALRKLGVISKTRYEAWKKKVKGKSLIGAWQCRYCSFKDKCVPMEYPDLRYLALDLSVEEDDVPVSM